MAAPAQLRYSREEVCALASRAELLVLGRPAPGEESSDSDYASRGELLTASSQPNISVRPRQKLQSLAATRHWRHSLPEVGILQVSQVDPCHTASPLVNGQ